MCFNNADRNCDFLSQYIALNKYDRVHVDQQPTLFDVPCQGWAQRKSMVGNYKAVKKI